MAGANREQVKVVFINTQRVEVDPMSFKSVVQSLTGKDSCVAWIKESSSVGQKRSRPVSISGGRLEKSCGVGGGGGGCASESVVMLAKDASFKEFDRVPLELPPIAELPWLWSD